MRERAFLTRRQDGWERLEALLERADRGGIAKLDASDLENLALLYRSATTDLAAAKSREYSEQTRTYLNRLTARAHAYVYAEAARGGWSRIASFFTQTFPREFRRSSGIIAGTTALFVIVSIFAYFFVAVRTSNAYAILPPSEIPDIQKSLHDSNFGFDRSFSAAMSAQIITNNIRVAAMCFAGGLTLGILTVWALVGNGLMVGGLGALFAARGFGVDFYATVAPHGVIELTAIQISSAAGLLMAKAILIPGRLRRIDALRVNARRAGVLLLGVVGMLCVAGTIEGFVSPQRTSIPFRFAFGGVTAVGLLLYFSFAGRARKTESEVAA
jgi:uncharacterized membrane protein SpoIIM required for sporulation